MNLLQKFSGGKDRLSMGCGIPDIIEQIYGTTSTPVAVTDKKYNILWKNSAAEGCDLFSGDSLSFIDHADAEEGSKTVLRNGGFHLFNVMKCASEDCYIVEYMGKNLSCDLGHTKSYFNFLCTRLRDSASQITMAADDIELFVKTGDMNISSSLNRIDRNVMLLLKEAVIPEIIFYAADTCCKDEPINLAHEVAYAVKDAENVLGRLSEVWQNEVCDVCAAMNQSVFETIISCMTAQACCGELYPDRVEYVVSRNKDNKEQGFVSVRSVCLSDKKNNPFKLEFMKQDEFFTDAVFNRILHDKYGIVFEKIQHNDGIEVIMSLRVLPENKGIVRTDARRSLRQDRFSSMAISLSEKHCPEHYKNIKME